MTHKHPPNPHALWCSEKAKAFFEEARLVKFSAQVQVYQQQHVAMQWRDALQKRFQGVQPRFALQLELGADVFRNELGLLAKETLRVVQPSVTAQVTNGAGAVTAGGEGGEDMTSSLEDWFKRLNSQTSTDPDEDRRLKEIAAMISIIAVAFGLSPREHEGRVREFISTQSDIWHAGKYAKEFSNIPELSELTLTPFMVQISHSYSLAFSPQLTQ